MKTPTLRDVVVSLSILALSPLANASGTTSAFAPEVQKVLIEVQTIARRCAFRPVKIMNGRKVEGRLRSRCPNLLISNNEALIQVREGVVHAILTDSPNSDGGDLNDLRFETRRGKLIAQIPGVLAYGDVLMALTGNSQIPEVIDSTVH